MPTAPKKTVPPKAAGLPAASATATLQAEITELNEEQLRLKEEVRELKQLQQRLEKENKKLKADALREAQQGARRREAAEQEYRAATKKIIELEAEQAQGDLWKVGRETGKHTFRLEIYVPETDSPHCQGKIEHLLTQHRQSFQSFDAAALAEFIGGYLPVAATPPAAPEAPAPPKLNVQLSKAFLNGFDMPRSMISSKDNFRVTLGLAFESFPGQHPFPLQFRIGLQAKSLETAQRTDIASLLVSADGPETTIELPVQGKQLVPGTYRLEATLVCQQRENAAPLATAFAEGHLLGVYEPEPEPLVNILKRVQQFGW